MNFSTHWLDRVTAPLAPRWTLRRMHARAAADLLLRNYEGAASGRRTQGWRKNSGDANAVMGPALVGLRNVTRDLVRNNPYAESALATIADHAVGVGILAKPSPADPRALAAWKAWAESTDCDAEGRHDFYGLQKLVVRTIVESGEVLVRRRVRYISDGYALPVQLQVLDPDFLDGSKEVARLDNGGRIIHGVEFDVLGRRAAYWLFPEHPGSAMAGFGALSPDSATTTTRFTVSVRVPAESVLHIFKHVRPGQVRGVSWFAPTIVRFKDFDEYEDATLMKQKIAACLAVVTSDVDGSAPPLGTVTAEQPGIDSLEPGMVLNVPAGRSVDVVQPPSVRDYDAYSKTQLKAIASGLGVTYEDMTGDYADLPFSAARMSRLRHWARVEDTRWRILIPQFCTPAWNWAMQAAAVMGSAKPNQGVEWTAAPAPMVDPVNEGLAFQRNIRTGLQSLSDALRERGMDPVAVLNEMAADNKLLDKLGIKLDSDPRQMTQAGQLQGQAAAPPAAQTPASARLLRASFTNWLARQDDDLVAEVAERMFGGR